MKSLPQPLILSVFHGVITDTPLKDQSSGQLIIGKDSDSSFFFKWTPDIDTKDLSRIQINRSIKGSKSTQIRSPSKYIHQIFLSSNRIQRIIITQQPHVFDISTLNPSEMHEFKFSINPIQYTLQLLQILAVNSVLVNCTTVVGDFWRVTTLNNANFCPSTENVLKVYDVPCENGVFIVPNIVVAPPVESISLVDGIAQAAISSKYLINGPLYERSPLSLDYYDKIVGTTIKISDIRLQVTMKGLDHDLRALLWPQLLDVLPFEKDVSEIRKMRIQEYNQLKSQWETLVPYQLNKRSKLRNAFQTIRMDVRRTNIPTPYDEKKVKQSMINILKTYAIYNYNIKYTQGLNDIVLPFILVLIDKMEEYEAITFWCFASFLEKVNSPLVESNMDGLMNIDLPYVFSIIQENEPKCSEWLINYKMEDLSFLVSSYMLAYRRSFDESKLERLWDSIIASTDPYHFMICFTAALVIYSYPPFAKIENCSSSHILQISNEVFSQLQVGSIIGLSLLFESNSKHLERRMPIHIETTFMSRYFRSKFEDSHRSYFENNLYL